MLAMSTIQPTNPAIRPIRGLRNVPDGLQLGRIRNPHMQPSDSHAVGELLKQAAATAYCRPALRAFGDALPADDSILTAALDEAATARDAKSFSHLYLGALFDGRRISAQVLELGAALLPEAMLLLHTALRLEGDVAESLAAAVRSGRMGSEREATALIAGWLDYERREATAPPEFLALTRRICRETMRTGLPFVRSLLCLVAKLSRDPVVATILNADMERDLSRPHSGRSPQVRGGSRLGKYDPKPTGVGNHARRRSHLETGDSQSRAQ